MSDLELMKAELEQERRSLAMLRPSATISKDEAIALIERCQRALNAAVPRIG
jgi:hypothetical protein